MQIRVHKSFKLNGRSFSTINELLSYSNSISTAIGEFLKVFFNDDKKVKLQTSGSTGAPKLIEVKKEFMINSAKATGLFFGLNNGTKALLCMNPNFVGGKMMLVRAIVLGWHLDVVAPSKNPLKELTQEYDFSAMVPLQVSNSFLDLHKIKKLIIGGGVVSNELLKQLQSVSTECFATYGMTETVSHIAVKKLNQLSLLQEGTMKQPYFKVLPNITISKDQRNCLIINAPTVAEDLIVTNDVVELISTTEFKWLGRFDNIINSGGVKLNPELIEEKLAAVIEQRFFVAGIPDEVLGEKLILMVEGISTTINDLNIDLSNKVKNLKSISKYEQPKEIYFLELFIETPTGKIKREKTLELSFPNS